MRPEDKHNTTLLINTTAHNQYKANGKDIRSAGTETSKIQLASRRSAGLLSVTTQNQKEKIISDDRRLPNIETSKSAPRNGGRTRDWRTSESFCEFQSKKGEGLGEQQSRESQRSKSTASLPASIARSSFNRTSKGFRSRGIARDIGNYAAKAQNRSSLLCVRRQGRRR